MKIGVLGTGMVGNTIASKLVTLGHDVVMGARSAGNEKAVAWARAAGANGASGTFADAARHGQMVWNCTAGGASLEALRMAGAEQLIGKVLVDVANPLDFSKGMPPTLSVCNTDSLGEQIQRTFPRARVVKTLNTVNHHVMVDPARVPRAEHSVFVCGNDVEARASVTSLLREFGWRDIIDLGDITAARGTEAYLLLWLRLWQAAGTPDLNVKLVR